MNEKREIRVVLADDDALVRDGLALVLQQSGGFYVSACVKNGAEALAAVSKARPDVVLLDVRMPDMDGLECCRRLHAQYPELAVLMLSTFQDDAYLAQALEAGAVGYLLKHQSTEAVTSAIRNAATGNVTFEPRLAASLRVQSTTPNDAFLQGLPPRERDVLELIVAGSSNKEIADTIHLSVGTVRNYVSSLLQFADVRDRTQLVIWYYRNTQNHEDG